MRSLILLSYRALRKVVISIVGLTVLGLGIAMIVLPGPAILVIPVGVAILGTEYAWAARLLRKFRKREPTDPASRTNDGPG